MTGLMLRFRFVGRLTHGLTPVARLDQSGAEKYAAHAIVHRPPVLESYWASRICGTRKNWPSVFGAFESAASRESDGATSSARKTLDSSTA